MNARIKSALHAALTSAWLFILLTPLVPLVAAQPDMATADTAGAIDAAIVKALQRDLGLSPQEAQNRLMAEKTASRIYSTLRQALGGTYAGAWFDPADLKFVVATTDKEKADLIQINGARSVLVKRNMQQLNGIVQQLDQAAVWLSEEQKLFIWEWGVDVKTNSVVVTIQADNPQALAAARAFIKKSGADASAIRIDQSAQEPPKLFYDVRGGDQYTNTTDQPICSIGFSVNGGYITAGHCSGGTMGDAVNGYNGVPQGAFAGSVYPGEDRAWVSVNGSWTPEPCVGPASNSDRNCNDSPNVKVFGSQETAIGNTVCRYGRTTNGPHCGVIQAKNQTVNFQKLEGGCCDTVSNLTKTDACAEPGDSGGPFVWNNQGQGTLTGGTGDCTTSGTTYFYPINRSLNGFSLTLLTAQPPPPSQPCAASSGTNQGTLSTVRWNMTAASGGASWSVTGNGVDPFVGYNGQFGNASVHCGCLSGHPVADRLQGFCSGQWSVTASCSCPPGPPP